MIMANDDDVIKIIDFYKLKYVVINNQTGLFHKKEQNAILTLTDLKRIVH